MSGKIERAKKIAKARYGALCIFSLREHPDGAHIFPVSTYPELADEPDNIVPLHRLCHSAIGIPCFDYREDGTWRTVGEKLWMLLQLTHPDFRSRVKEQLQALEFRAEKTGIDFPEPQRMHDVDALLKSELRRRA